MVRRTWLAGSASAASEADAEQKLRLILIAAQQPGRIGEMVRAPGRVPEFGRDVEHHMKIESRADHESGGRRVTQFPGITGAGGSRARREEGRGNVLLQPAQSVPRDTDIGKRADNPARE